jgi:hypothetical protein
MHDRVRKKEMASESGSLIMVEQSCDHHQLPDYICFLNQIEDILNQSTNDLYLPIIKRYTLSDKEKYVIQRLTTTKITENTFIEQIRKDVECGLNICASCFDKTATNAVIPCCHVSFCDICIKNKNRCGVCNTLFRDQVRLF